MRSLRRTTWKTAVLLGLCAALPPAAPGAPGGAEDLRRQLDAPLLFVKRHNYTGIHIYDTYYKWRPGGGIYVLENPADPPAEHRIRPLIDATTPGSLGAGIYSEPELSYDARRVLFCYKPEASGSTSIYEIGIDGSGLRRLTDPTPYCADYKGRPGGQHDVGPSYLADGRIVFTSTRFNGLVPCFNSGVDILHVMNADGSDAHAISVNNVNEFDPVVMADGRVLHGRWEYIDKTALTQQSVWTIFPDGTNETALYANNMVHPEAVLDARPVPGEPHLIAGTFTPHNAPPRGTVAIVDTEAGKNDPNAIFNFDRPDNPTHDRGESCEPWPLSKDVVLYSAQPPGAKRNAILLADRAGRRVVVCADAEIDLHSPMLVKPRPRPPVLAAETDRHGRAGRLYVADIYQGLDGVRRGEVKQLRVIEETSRTSPTTGGAFNQTFLMSAALAWSAKNYLGVVPVEPDGSAYFEVPAGRAVYLHALDADGRLVRSMRTFIQAAPGVTRSCVGCHEYKYGAPPPAGLTRALRREPSRLTPESWGSGFVDFPGMVQPILDRHCVSCHGGEKGISAKLDLSGGWTEYFSISYENLVSRRDTQLTASLISGIDCMNGTSLWSARIFPPWAHGSGAAKLADVLVSGHKKRIGKLTRAERDLVLAWIDTNGLYHGTWDYSPHGCRIAAWGGAKGALVREMTAAGCVKCHQSGKKALFEDDWFNLERPELSRILRAPLAKGGEGLGLAFCRDRKIDPAEQRVCLLVGGAYHHAVLPVDSFKRPPAPEVKNAGEPVISFASTADPHYQAMLQIIRDGRRGALAAPRVDMPGATIIPGSHRQMLPPALPDRLPELHADVEADGVVRLTWPRSAEMIGLRTEIHRGPAPDFAPGAKTLLAAAAGYAYVDANAPPGEQHYALVLASGPDRSPPVRASVVVPPPLPPAPPTDLKAAGGPMEVELTWRAADGDDGRGDRFCVYRAVEGSGEFRRLTPEPIAAASYVDTDVAADAKYAYVVRAVSRRGAESNPADPATASPLRVNREPTFTAPFARDAAAELAGGRGVKGATRGAAKLADGCLDLRGGGHVTFAHRGEFDLRSQFSVSFWVRLDEATQMPVFLSCGKWQGTGWFLQRLGGTWRWHVGGVDCDGGSVPLGRWVHVAATFDGRAARLYQDGKQVAARDGPADLTPWPGPLFVGQYGPSPGPQYQVLGRIAALSLYRCALTAGEAAALSRTGPPGATSPAK